VCIFTDVFVLEHTDNGASHKMNCCGKLLYIFPSTLQYTTLVHYRGFDAPSSQKFDMKNWWCDWLIECTSAPFVLEHECFVNWCIVIL
jgi:hypothetical protein